MSWVAGPEALELQVPACPALRACAAVPDPADSWLWPQPALGHPRVCLSAPLGLQAFPAVPIRYVPRVPPRKAGVTQARPFRGCDSGSRSPLSQAGCGVQPSVPASPGVGAGAPRAPGAGFAVGEALGLLGCRWACLRAGGLVCILAMGFWGPPRRAPRSSRPGLQAEGAAQPRAPRWGLGGAQGPPWHLPTFEVPGASPP